MVLLPADVHQDSSLVKSSLGMLGSQQLCSCFLTTNSICINILFLLNTKEKKNFNTTLFRG